MSSPSSDAPVSGGAPSLLVARIAAAVGAVLAVVAVVVAFTVSPWLGVGALFLSPGLPMLLVLVAENLRR